MVAERHFEHRTLQRSTAAGRPTFRNQDFGDSGEDPVAATLTIGLRAVMTAARRDTDTVDVQFRARFYSVPEGQYSG